MIKKCKIVPKFPLPDLVMFKRVEFPCTMELNKSEIKRAINYANVYEILNDGSEILLDPCNYNLDNNLINTKKGIADIIGFKNKIPVIKANTVGKAGIGIARLY